MTTIVQTIGIITGVGLGLLVFYATLYIAEELEKTSFWFIGRALKAVAGAIIWGVIGLIFGALLLALGLVVWVFLLHRPLALPLSLPWAAGAAAVLLVVYMLWGGYQGAIDNLSEALGWYDRLFGRGEYLAGDEGS
ncbi:MAG: hypothetical protein L0332_33710 [Chloroflexi bacterium]|nr:hypothetical protein [Chloroflexota bacterium]MCI0578771.1 hypothetical protein [Chloroflexota bacterium]MCI0648732.1 hypothetical protein [Chloroflexota bacterium]MCI0731660.1 hypothetical protein [Chloroflexota bacterium]